MKRPRLPFSPSRASTAADNAWGVARTNGQRDLLAPDMVRARTAHVEVGETHIGTLAVTGYPPWARSGWADEILVPPEPRDIVLHVTPQDRRKAIERTSANLTGLKAQRNQATQRGQEVNEDREQEIESAQTLLTELTARQEGVVRVGFYIGVHGRTADDMEDRRRRLSNSISLQEALARKLYLQKTDPLHTLMPVGQDRSQLTVDLDCGSLARTFPFGTLVLNQPDGIFFGWNPINKTPVCINPFSKTADNSNSCIIAKSGAGKSYTAKLIEVLRSIARGVQVIVIDPKDEYWPIAQRLGFQVLRLSVGGKDRINPLALPPMENNWSENGGGGDAMREHFAKLHGLINLLIGRTDQVTEYRGVLDTALYATYAKKDIHPGLPYAGKVMPVLSDLVATLRDVDTNYGLATKLEPFSSGTYSGLFEGQTSIKSNAPLTVFSMQEVPDEVKPAMMYMVAQYVWSQAKADVRTPRRLIIDEAHRIVRFPAGDVFVEDLARTARSFHLGVTAITQDPQDFVTKAAGRAMLLNSSYVILLKQKKEIAASLKKDLVLSDEQVKYLTSIDVGQGMVLVQHPDIENKQVPIPVIFTASPSMHELCELDPRRMAAPTPAASGPAAAAR